VITRLSAAALVALALSAACVAAPIRFDFGDGTVSPDTGVSANVVIADNIPVGSEAETVDGVTITLEGIAGPAGGTWQSTPNGIGIETTGQAGTAAGRPRIDKTIGESVNFSFDVDVTINSIRLGNMVEDTVEISFVSGTDPFAGGSFTYSTAAGPTDDIPVNVFVTAGTVLSLGASVPDQQGVLWNDIVVTPIPEPSAMAMAGIVAATVGIALRRRRIDPWQV
jgi:hypothetical protein